MICYVHLQASGIEVPAVATCKNCGVGLCLTHLASLQESKPGGMDYGCLHVMPRPASTAVEDTSRLSALHGY